MEKLAGGQRMSTIGKIDEVNVLKLTLHDRLVGYLAGYKTDEMF